MDTGILNPIFSIDLLNKILIGASSIADVNFYNLRVWGEVNEVNDGSGYLYA